MFIALIFFMMLWPMASLATVPVAPDYRVGDAPRSPLVVAPVAQDVKQFGTVRAMTLADNPQQQYYLYVPRSGGAGRPVMVTVHGISRNALEHAQRFAPFAEQYGVVLIAPLFPKDSFPKYQRLEGGGAGGRPDLVLQQIIAEVGRLTGAVTDKVFMFGYSGGGQFTHRYAMRYPEQVSRFVVGAAGWYTFPDPNKKYPYGIGARRDLPDFSFDPARFLAVPGGVLVGERDHRQGSALNHSQKISAQEGDNRDERGREWVAAMNAKAHDNGFSTAYFFELMPRCGHSFTRCMKRGNMGHLVFQYFFPASGQ